MKSYSKLFLLSIAVLISSCSEESNVVDTKKDMPPVGPTVTKAVEKRIPTVSSQEQDLYKQRIIRTARPKVENLVGETFFAGFKARRQGFTSAERVELENIKLGAFKCKYHDPAGVKKAEELTDIWCHFHGNFHFKDVTETAKVYKELLKVRIDGEGLPVFEPMVAFRVALESGFVNKDPLFNNEKWSKHFPNLKEGKLSIGMPEEFLKVVWGEPKHIVDFELNANGRRETYVYRDYFVVLNNRVVTSVHRFNDVKPEDPTAGL